MRSYPFIDELFRNVLTQSKAVRGRFFILPKSGRELNSDELNQVIKDLVRPDPIIKKYPIAIMLPPVSQGFYFYNKEDWEHYRITMFFLTTSYVAGVNQVNVQNVNTGTSTHTILQDWHDMKRAAVGFLRVLDKTQRDLGLVNNKFRLDHHKERTITPVSEIGTDNLSGVRLDFLASIFIGCEDLEDYNPEEIGLITAPEDDSHPEHQL